MALFHRMLIICNLHGCPAIRTEGNPATLGSGLLGMTMTETVDRQKCWDEKAVRLELHRPTGKPGLVKCFAHRPANLDHLFRASVEATPHAEALVGSGLRLTYRELDRRVTQVAAGLRKLDVSPGDRVALALANTVEFIETLLACARIEAVAVPLNIRMRLREITSVLVDSRAVGVIFDAALREEIPSDEQAPECRVRIVTRAAADAGALAYDEIFRNIDTAGFIPTPGDEDSVCALVYTSGTTGKPKGAPITHLAMIHSALSFVGRGELRTGERTILAVPGTHITGIAAVIYPTFHLSGCLILVESFQARDFTALATQERCSYTFLVPAMINLMLLKVNLRDHDLSAWRTVAFGGAPMPVSTTQEITGAIPHLRLMQAYGATETTAAVTGHLLTKNMASPQIASIGKPMPCADIRVLDESGIEVPRGMTGEIWIAGPSVIAGYWQDQEQTDKAVAGGYWRSGDIGWVDDDGFVYIGDRMKDVINRAGFKVYSIEVESVLMAHPSVNFAAVIGYPDSVLGEKTHAFIVAAGEIDLDALRDHCRKELSDYKVPDGMTVVDGDDLPRNAAGKVVKHALRQMLMAEART